MPGGLLFQLGGHDSVRGYSSRGVAVETGLYVQNDRHREGSGETQGVDLCGLLDLGQVNTTFPQTTTMASLGAGSTYRRSDNSSPDSAAPTLLPAIAG